jgi:CcdB protein
MRRYDVCAVRNSKNSLVVVLQHDATAHLSTCIVAPLIAPFTVEKEDKIRLTIDVNGKLMQLQTDRLAAIPRRMIGAPVATASDQQDRIKNAIDRLFIGF